MDEIVVDYTMDFLKSIFDYAGEDSDAFHTKLDSLGIRCEIVIFVSEISVLTIGISLEL